jgi:sec-independent protein translocase protein TatA
MPTLGPAEILVIVVVALLVFGSDKMPEIGRQLVRSVREFRRIRHYLGSELRGVVSEFDVGGDDDADATTNGPRPGGDPVPRLPAKDVEAPSASAGAGPAHAASASSSADQTPQQPPQPARPPSPGVDGNGGSPPAQPSDST